MKYRLAAFAVCLACGAPAQSREQAEAKAGAVFTSREQGHDAIWILTGYDETALRINYASVAPRHNVAELEITLKAAGDKETEAKVTHRLPSLSEDGDGYVKLERDHGQRAVARRLRELTRIKSPVTPGSQAKAPAPRLWINSLRQSVERASACQDF